MSNNPIAALNNSPMSVRQWVAVVVVALISGLDGLDVVVISFASPLIAKGWGLGMSELGVVLAADLIGMAIGSIVIGHVTDRFGRRPLLLLGLAITVVGTGLCAIAWNVNALMVFRLLTGIGIGGTLSTGTAIVSETSNTRNRNFSIGLFSAGFPFLAVLGGLVVSHVIQTSGWKDAFAVTAVAAIVLFLLTLALVPETVPYLTRQGKRRAAAIERVLTRYGISDVGGVWSVPVAPKKVTLRELLDGQNRKRTVFLVVGYFCHTFTLYYLLQWLPEIFVTHGFGLAHGLHALVILTAAQFFGALLFGVVARRYGLKSVAAVSLGLCVASLLAFGWVFGQHDLSVITTVIVLVGIFVNAGTTGYYAAAPQAYESNARATGVGLMIGIGRGGAAISPIIAGALFQAKLGLLPVSAIMAVGSFVALLLITRVSLSDADAASNAVWDSPAVQ